MQILPKSTIEIGIATFPLDGRGDIINGWNIDGLVKKLYPNTKVDFSVIELKDKTYREFAKAKSYTITNVKDLDLNFANEIVEESEFLKKIKNYAKIILFTSCLSDDAIPIEFINIHGDNLIRFREFGCTPQSQPDRILSTKNEFTLGFDEGESGAIFRDDLWKYRTDRQKLDKIKRLEQLATLPKHVLETIFGCRDFKMENLNALVSEFSKNTKLYVGYGFSERSLQMFMHAITQFELKSDIVIVFLSNVVNMGQVDAPDTVMECLTLSGFKKFEFIDCNLNGSKPIRCESKQKQRNAFQFGLQRTDRSLKVIFTKLSPEQTIDLFKSSEKEVLVTGDCSFIESLTMGCRPVYDCRAHKLKFIESFIKIIGLHDRGLKEIYDKACFDSDSVKNRAIIAKARDNCKTLHLPQGEDWWSNMKEYFEYLTDPKISAKWDSVVDSLYNKHNLETKLPGILKL